MPPFCFVLLLCNSLFQIASQLQTQLQSATKRFLVTYRCIAKRYKALCNAHLMQLVPESESLPPYIYIAPDKVLFFHLKITDIFLISAQKHVMVLIRSASVGIRSASVGTSNEYPHHIFLCRNKKNNMWIPPLMWSYVSNDILLLWVCNRGKPLYTW